MREMPANSRCSLDENVTELAYFLLHKDEIVILYYTAVWIAQYHWLTPGSPGVTSRPASDSVLFSHSLHQNLTHFLVKSDFWNKKLLNKVIIGKTISSRFHRHQYLVSHRSYAHTLTWAVNSIDKPWWKLPNKCTQLSFQTLENITKHATTTYWISMHSAKLVIDQIPVTQCTVSVWLPGSYHYRISKVWADAVWLNTTEMFIRIYVSNVPVRNRQTIYAVVSISNCSHSHSLLLAG